MKSMSSASMDSGSHTELMSLALTSRCHQQSRPSFISTSLPARRTTTQVSTLGQVSSASSALGLSGIGLPPRSTASAVISTLAWQSSMRLCRAMAEKPPNTTEWTAPRRAQASSEMASSGTMGR